MKSAGGTHVYRRTRYWDEADGSKNLHASQKERPTAPSVSTNNSSPATMRLSAAELLKQLWKKFFSNTTPGLEMMRFCEWSGPNFFAGPIN